MCGTTSVYHLYSWRYWSMLLSTMLPERMQGNGCWEIALGVDPGGSVKHQYRGN